MNITTITQNADGTWNVTVSLLNGYSDTLEGLYSREDCIAFSHMFLTHTNRRYFP